LYDQHVADGIPRWDTDSGSSDGYSTEMWAQRTLDHLPIIGDFMGIHIVEGVYGQDGDGFIAGPGPDGTPQVFMTNMFLFGKDMFKVDIIGHWLGGHEPGNFGLFHLAKERGLSTALNPHNIPVYVWEDAGPRKIDLDSLPRQPLLTYYLGREGEPFYHMCDEAYVYPPEPVPVAFSGGNRPGMRLLGPARMNLSDCSMNLEYRMPRPGHALIEIYNASGDRGGRVASGWQQRGIHAAVWNMNGNPAGGYFIRFRTNGYEEVKRMSIMQ